MSCTICLDTNVLQSFSLSKEVGLKLVYEKAKNSPDFVFSNWTYLLFVEKTLIVSPLTVWEFIANRMSGRSVNEKTNLINALSMRFGATTALDSMTLAISYLFAAVTGIPCDDSYHFVHAVRNSADFFASVDKDFDIYKAESKAEYIVKMKELLTYINPIDSIRTAEIITEIDRIAELNWARMIRSPIDVPQMLQLNKQQAIDPS